jgi:hypothetical protein
VRWRSGGGAVGARYDSDLDEVAVDFVSDLGADAEESELDLASELGLVSDPFEPSPDSSFSRERLRVP